MSNTSQALLRDLSITLAGFPATTVFAGTLRGTTAPAPTTAFRPIRHPWQEDGAAPYPHIILDHYRFGYFPALDTGFRLKVVGGGIDLDDRPDHDMIANMHLITIQNGTQDIQIDMITDINVLTVATVEGWLDDRILTDSS